MRNSASLPVPVLYLVNGSVKKFKPDGQYVLIGLQVRNVGLLLNLIAASAAIVRGLHLGLSMQISLYDFRY